MHGLMESPIIAVVERKKKEKIPNFFFFGKFTKTREYIFNLISFFSSIRFKFHRHWLQIIYRFFPHKHMV